MDDFILVVRGLIISYLNHDDISQLKLKNNLSEKDWKERVHTDYSEYLADVESRADFSTWKDFYYYLYNLTYSRATLIETTAAEYTSLTLSSIKEVIYFTEIERFFHPPTCHSIRRLKKGDVIKFAEDNYMTVNENSFGLYLKYEDGLDSFGIRNPRIHNWTPIYEFPITYWSLNNLDRRLNLFGFYLHDEGKIEIISDTVLLLANILIYKNVKYMVIFKSKISRDNFSNSKVYIRCMPLFHLFCTHMRTDVQELLRIYNISKYRTLVEVGQV